MTENSAAPTGTMPPGGPVSDRMQALLSRAVEEQVSEQRAVSTVLAELCAQVATLSDGVRLLLDDPRQLRARPGREVAVPEPEDPAAHLVDLEAEDTSDEDRFADEVLSREEPAAQAVEDLPPPAPPSPPQPQPAPPQAKRKSRWRSGG